MTSTSAETGPVLLFDASCVLCDRSVSLVAAREEGDALRFAALRSPAGERLLAEHGLGDDPPDSLVLVEDGRAWIRSDAALRVAARMRPPWRWLAVLRVVPRPIRDLGYRLVARLRYRLFGRKTGEACGLPPQGLAGRVLAEGMMAEDGPAESTPV